MKYIKTYEESTFMPLEGDYIITHADSTGVCKILKIDMYNDSLDYVVETIITGQLIKMTLDYFNIKRFATKKEIEKFELEKQTIKYNL